MNRAPSSLTSMMPVTGSRELRSAYGRFPSGVAAVCALVNGRPVGMAASSFTSVSLHPPLVSVCMRNVSATWCRLKPSPRLGVSFLGETQDAACRQLAAQTGDRFAGIEWEASAAGAVFICGAAAWLECSLYRSIPAGDHEIAVLKVERLKTERGVDPLVFHASRFRQLREC